MSNIKRALLITTSLLACTALAQLPGRVASGQPLTLTVVQGDQLDFITASPITSKVVTRTNPDVRITTSGNHLTFHVGASAKLDMPSCASFFTKDGVTRICIVPQAPQTDPAGLGVAH